MLWKTWLYHDHFSECIGSFDWKALYFETIRSFRWKKIDNRSEDRVSLANDRILSVNDRNVVVTTQSTSHLWGASRLFSMNLGLLEIISQWSAMVLLGLWLNRGLYISLIQMNIFYYGPLAHIETQEKNWQSSSI